MAQASRRQPAQAPSVQRQHQRKATKSVIESSLPRSSTVFSLTKLRAPSGTVNRNGFKYLDTEVLFMLIVQASLRWRYNIFMESIAFNEVQH